MGPTTYTLCQKAVIGPAMWIVGLCVFPPLISDVSLPLSSAGAAATASFSVPVDKNYQFILEFEFGSTEARLQDKIVGSNYRAECEKEPAALLGNPEYGRPIPVRVVIRKAQDRSIVVDRNFISLCMLGHMSNKKSRGVGWVTLARGDYTVEIANLVAQDHLADIKTSISLVSGSAK